VQNAILENDNSVLRRNHRRDFLLAINYLVIRFLYDHRKLEQIVEGRPDILIEDGKIHEHKTQTELITKEGGRGRTQTRVDTLSEVRQCVLEPGERSPS